MVLGLNLFITLVCKQKSSTNSSRLSPSTLYLLTAESFYNLSYNRTKTDAYLYYHNVKVYLNGLTLTTNVAFPSSTQVSLRGNVMRQPCIHQLCCNVRVHAPTTHAHARAHSHLLTCPLTLRDWDRRGPGVCTRTYQYQLSNTLGAV